MSFSPWLILGFAWIFIVVCNMWYWKGELKWSVKEAKEVGLVKQSLLQCNMLYSAATAPLQFAIRPSLMSCYYWGPHRRNIIPFIAGSLQHLLHYFPVGLSVLQFFPSVLCSTVVSVKKDGRQVINFTSFEKEFSLSDGSFCRQKSLSMFCVKPLKHFSNVLWDLPIDEMPTVQNGKQGRDQNSFYLRNCY